MSAEVLAVSPDQHPHKQPVGIPARVWVVEDDEAIRDALSLNLATEGYEVRADVDARQAQEVVDVFHPDLAILDVRLPRGPNGYETAQALRRDSDLPVLFLTAADSLQDRLKGFHAGGDDYLVKPFSMAELLVRAQALLRRSGRLGLPVHQVGDLIVDEVARLVTRSGVPVELTKTEHDVLALLARRSGQVISKLQLLAEVWRFEAYDPNLVEVHVSSLRRKLEAHGPRILHTVRGVGYTLRP